MDPFARKMIYGSFVYGGMMLLMFAVLTVVYLHTRPRCSDRVVAEATDQARQWTATVMERRCGTDAPFFTHVNLRPAGKDVGTGFFSGSATEGEVFLIEQDAAGSGITLHWTSPTTLSIQCPRCAPALVRKHDERWGNVVIEYGLPQR
ncbi:MAG TPA: hypothetical protein VNZ47_09550 [Candidatus Dormibacteraeota bacterium]|jgi:hypothetical protein|nr:hypothetical protein [Candidatus Dormibacteraeota bacterium]